MSFTQCKSILITTTIQRRPDEEEEVVVAAAKGPQNVKGATWANRKDRLTRQDRILDTNTRTDRLRINRKIQSYEIV